MLGLAITAAVLIGVFAALYGLVIWLRRSNEKAFAAMTDEQRFVYEDLLQQIENPQPPVGVAATEGDIVGCPHCGTPLFRWRRTASWYDERDLVRDLESVDDRLRQPSYADVIPDCPECGSGAWAHWAWLTRVREAVQ